MTKREIFILGFLAGAMTVLLLLAVFQPTPEFYCGGQDTCLPIGSTMMSPSDFWFVVVVAILVLLGWYFEPTLH